MRESEREAKERLYSAAPAAVDTLVALLGSGEPATRARAAQGILSRVWPSGALLDPEEALRHSATAQSERAQDLLELFRRLAEEPNETDGRG